MPVSVDVEVHREREKGQRPLRGAGWEGLLFSHWSDSVIVSQIILIKNCWIEYHHKLDLEGTRIIFSFYKKWGASIMKLEFTSVNLCFRLMQPPGFTLNLPLNSVIFKQLPWITHGYYIWIWDVVVNTLFIYFCFFLIVTNYHLPLTSPIIFQHIHSRCIGSRLFWLRHKTILMSSSAETRCLCSGKTKWYCFKVGCKILILSLYSIPSSYNLCVQYTVAVIYWSHLIRWLYMTGTLHPFAFQCLLPSLGTFCLWIECKGL